MRVARKGLPATEESLNNTRPLLARLDPFLRNLTPILDYVGLYKREIAAFFANDTAATQATDVGFADDSRQVHYLRTTPPTNPEMMAAWPYRLGTNRSNPYTAPGGYDKLATEGHLEVFGSYLCTSNPTPAPPTAVDPYYPAATAALVDHFVFGFPENVGKAPPCDPQAPLGNIVGQPGLFPRLQPLP